MFPKQSYNLIPDFKILLGACPRTALEVSSQGCLPWRYFWHHVYVMHLSAIQSKYVISQPFLKTMPAESQNFSYIIAITLIHYPLPFFTCTAHGYVTSYCEDSPSIGTFQYRLLGFQDPPTDYYPRPFFLAAEESKSDENPHCYGSEKIFNYHLDLAKKIYEQYPEQKKFIFHFPGKILLKRRIFRI